MINLSQILTKKPGSQDAIEQHSSPKQIMLIFKISYPKILLFQLTTVFFSYSVLFQSVFFSYSVYYSVLGIVFRTALFCHYTIASLKDRNICTKLSTALICVPAVQKAALQKSNVPSHPEPQLLIDFIYFCFYQVSWE